MTKQSDMFSRMESKKCMDMPRARQDAEGACLKYQSNIIEQLRHQDMSAELKSELFQDNVVQVQTEDETQVELEESEDAEEAEKLFLKFKMKRKLSKRLGYALPPSYLLRKIKRSRIDINTEWENEFFRWILNYTTARQVELTGKLGPLPDKDFSQIQMICEITHVCLFQFIVLACQQGYLSLLKWFDSNFDIRKYINERYSYRSTNWTAHFNPLEISIIENELEVARWLLGKFGRITEVEVADVVFWMYHENNKYVYPKNIPLRNIRVIEPYKKITAVDIDNIFDQISKSAWLMPSTIDEASTKKMLNYELLGIVHL